jgi:hypothetical protein
MLFVAVLVAATAAFVPSASATTSTVKVAIAGSTGVWQEVALSTYNYNPNTGVGDCPGANFVVAPPCHHYTDNTKFLLNDTRPSLNSLGGTTVSDKADLWIVWDSPTGTVKRNVWFYIKPDTIIANKCYFAKPQCNVTSPASYVWTTVGNKISSTLWGTDEVPPSDVQSLFTAATGPVINTLSTELRPEDALFEQCRVNSVLGNGANGGFGDGLDGLGYSPGPAGGAGNPSGQCPAYDPTHSNLGKLVGQQIHSGITGSTAASNVLAFNISGKDPFTNSTVAAGTAYYVGAVPIVFVVSKSSTINSGLSGALDATSAQLQTIFSGAECDAEVLGLPQAPINAYLREPLSGTMTTTEEEVFRRPTKTVPPQAVLGVSQETGVGANFTLNNPCGHVGGNTPGNRIRGIGTGEVLNGNAGVGGVQFSGGANNDGIAYTFNSFGNMSAFAGSANYGYLTLDGEDGIGINTLNQELPVCTVPCPEAGFSGWGAGNSYPALRHGNYSAWTLVHMISASAATAVQDLINGSLIYAVNDVPDYIPYKAVAGTADVGMQIWLTHYQQRDGADNKIGTTVSNGTFSTDGNHNPLSGDKGGQAGGCTILTTAGSGITSTTMLEYIQANVTESGGSQVVTCSLDRDTK